MIRTIRMLAAVGALTLMSAAAYAHPMVKTSNPADGAVVAQSPKEIRVTFSERLVPKFSGLEVTDESGRVVATGEAGKMVSAADKRQLLVPLKTSLKPGTYKVEWHAVSADTHRVKGQYAFTVKG